MNLQSHDTPASRRCIPGLLLVFLLAAHGNTEADTRILSRDEAIRIAFRENHEIGLATLEIDRAKARLRWSGRLDNPELEISTSTDKVGNNENEGNFEVAFTQAFPLTSRLKQERHLRRHQVILAEAEIAERRRQLAGEVDLALVELIMVREKIAVANQLVGLNETMTDFLETQMKQGIVSSLDVMQAKLSARTLEQQAKALATEETHHLLALNKLLGLDPETPFRPGESPRLPASRPTIEVSLKTVLSRRPDYVLALSRIDETAAALALEEAKRWEDVSLRLFVEQDDAVDLPEGFDGNTFAGFGISIPLPLRDRNQEGIEQARINREAAGKEVEAARFHIRAECEEAFHERTDSWELAREASGEILSLAEKNEAEFRKAYQQGQASLLQVQRAQEQVLELKNASIEFLADYHRAAARVRLATGSYPGLSVESGKSPK